MISTCEFSGVQTIKTKKSLHSGLSLGDGHFHTQAAFPNLLSEAPIPTLHNWFAIPNKEWI